MALNCHTDYIQYTTVLRMNDGSTRQWSKAYETLEQAVESLLPLIDEFGRENIKSYDITGQSRHIITIIEDSDEPEYIVLDADE